MLLQQARLFGQRIDAKIASRHNEAEQARTARLEEHSRLKIAERVEESEERVVEKARDEVRRHLERHV